MTHFTAFTLFSLKKIVMFTRKGKSAWKESDCIQQYRMFSSIQKQHGNKMMELEIR